MSLLKKLSSLIENKTTCSILILVNVAGSLFGYYYYLDQFKSTPIYLWIFVPDCPLYTSLFALFLAFKYNKFIQAFSFLIFFGLIKYGLWTVSAIALHSEYFFAVNFHLYVVLFILHGGMAFQSLTLKEYVKKTSKVVLASTFSWMVINDFFDYYVGTLTYVPTSAYLNQLLVQNLILDVLLPFVILIAGKISYFQS